MTKTAIIYDKWLSGLGGGEMVACSMAAILRDCGYDVTFVSQDAVSPEEIKSKLGIDITGIQFSTDQRSLIPTMYGQVSNLSLQQPDLFINTSFMDYTYGFAKKNIYYVHFPTPIRSFLFNAILLFFQKTNLHKLLPKKLKERIVDRLRAGIYFDMQSRINSYQIILSNSEFTKSWIKKYWGKEAHVLYPPVKLIAFCDQRLANSKKLITNPQSQISKQNWICSVGRFFTLGHGKKQGVMIEAFKKLISNNQYPITSDLQLHLVGGVGNEPSSLRFIEDLRAEAKGYPIFFHLNAKRREVEDVLLKSKIYWHAAGFGEDPQKDPIKFEHFGIAPIEAISSGCIPLLYGGGGLTEIIEMLGLSKEKHLFSSSEDLISKSIHLIKEKERNLPEEIYENIAHEFSVNHFKETFISLIT